MAERSSNTSSETDDSESYSTHLVWLDKNIEDHSNKKNQKRFRELDNNIKCFSDKRPCIDYIKKQDVTSTKSSILLIISGSFSEEIIPQIHNCKCLVGIFIFCINAEYLQHLKFPKLRAICTDIYELLEKIENSMNEDTFDFEFSLFNNQSNTDAESTIIVKEKAVEQRPIRNLKEDQARFLWFSKCHNFMIELEHDDNQAKQEMISACRRSYKNDKQKLAKVDAFESESLEDNAEHAIYWYTQNSIIFRCINEALVSGNISTIYSYRYMIKLLCRQLKDLHEKYQKTNSDGTLRLYRGQQLKLSQILLISKHRNDLISLNGFISTTLEEDVAKTFSFGRAKEGHEPVMFVIDIDLTTKHSIAFANISELSHFPDEEEILLSIGSVFRIESVDFDERKRMYRIHLSLSPHDQLMVNKYIEQTFAKEVDSTNQAVLFGKLVFDMGEYQFALDYFKNGINYLSNNDNHYQATYLNNIGVCHNAIGEKDEALKYYKAASKIYKEANNHQELGACYHNIASLYYDQKNYETARQWALDALEKRQQSPLGKASTLDLLGCIQLAKYDAEAASNSLREALKIRLKYLSKNNPNHPDIGISYQNLGRLDSKLSAFLDAERNYLRAAEIFRHNYPESHPLVVEITRCLKEIERKLRN